jgi:medium-chain acyl-[acyl-carrier-protein] hydrolase
MSAGHGATAAGAHGSVAGRWIRTGRAGPAPLRLICLPHAGGGASLFRDWPAALEGRAEVCAVQLPGREGRLSEPPIAALGPLVDALHAGLRPWLGAPFALFGLSMGALLAYELAQRLQEEGGPGPCAVIVAAHRAPHLPDRRDPIGHLDDEAFVDELRRLDGTPPGVFDEPELRELLLGALRADVALCETYRHEARAPLRCPVAALGGRDDPQVDPGELLAWHEHTSERFTLTLFRGGHFPLGDASAALRAAVRTELGRAIAVGSGDG